jgi:hypothetical protein
MSDFLEDFEQVAPPTVLGEIANYIVELKKLRRKIEEKEEELKAAKAEEARLSCETIPRLFEQHRVSQLVDDSGAKVSIKEDVYCSIPEDPAKQKEALKFLTNNGGGRLIKDTLIVEDPEEAVISLLVNNETEYTRKSAVNTNSLKAFFKEQLGIKKGSTAKLSFTDVPPVFNLFVRKDTKID